MLLWFKASHFRTKLTQNELPGCCLIPFSGFTCICISTTWRHRIESFMVSQFSPYSSQYTLFYILMTALQNCWKMRGFDSTQFSTIFHSTIEIQFIGMGHEGKIHSNTTEKARESRKITRKACTRGSIYVYFVLKSTTLNLESIAWFSVCMNMNKM